ncbi:MAG TPA: methyltransferase domain-containing protein [Acidimicrobiales bacterium]|nr:methyltransferase domain-containing protein [Acidimicrobiales bacterium]
MNENHAALCSSAEWATELQEDVVRPLTGGVDLGERMLEIGPGPGAATEWLRHRVRHLTALEVDKGAAEELSERLAEVEVLVGDATAMTFADATFDSVGCFTMLHHVATATEQNRVLTEALRVLRPGGVLVGADSLASTELHDFHIGDTYNPIEPATLVTRLETIGFERITVSVEDRLTFIAYRPSDGDRSCASQPKKEEQAR